MRKRKQRRIISLRRVKAKSKAKYYAAWIVFCLVEAVVAFIPTLIAGFIIVPIASGLRGTPGMGGEYLLLACIFQMAFTSIHYKACDIIFGKEARTGEAKRTGRKVSRYKHLKTRVG